MVVLLQLITVADKTSGRILRGTGTHFIAYSPFGSRGPCECIDCLPKSGSNEGFVAETTRTNLFPLSIVDAVRDLAGVKDASSHLRYRFQERNSSSMISMGGFDTRNSVAVRTTTCAPSDVLSGRYLDPGERGVVMVEEGFSKLSDTTLGDVIRIAGVDFPVVGIVNTGIRPAKADVYMALADSETLINTRIVNPLEGRFNILLVETESAELQSRVMNDVKDLLGENAVLASYNCWFPAASVLGLQRNTVWILVGVICFSVVLISLKTQLSSVLERKRDLAILKAIGWSNRSVMLQILMESLVTALAGYALGIIIAISALVIIEMAGFIGTPVMMLSKPIFQVLGISLLFVIGGGALAGALPALNTLNHAPSEVLRHVN